METRDIYRNLSPLDHRYWLSNRELFEALSDRLSESASVRYCARAEVALLKAHLELRGMGGGLFAELDALAESVTAEEVYAEEERTRHNIRALVNVMKARVPSSCAHLVHLGATSVDILDTAQAMRLRDTARDILVPLLADLVLELCRLSIDEAETPQVGRTHGQHAVPITFGFAMAEYASRLGKSALRLVELSGDLRGKLSGATGSYNALSMSYADPEAVERLYLGHLGLRPGDHATQLVEPEHALRLLLEFNVSFGAVANLADDLRALQRTEIDEVREAFAAGQVGSSTMPQKRNPWNCEHVKSLWKAFFPRAATFFMDQISEHQRDLTNSASERFVADYLSGYAAALNRMLSVLKGLAVNRERMLSNLAMGGGSVLAEPAYVLLSEAGVADAHEVLRKATLAAEAGGLSLAAALEGLPEAKDAIFGRLRALGWDEPASFFEKPWLYRGRSAEKAREIGNKYRALMAPLSREGGGR